MFVHYFFHKVLAAVLVSTMCATPLHAIDQEHILHNFRLYGKDGVTPYAGLTSDSAGNFYGTLVTGGKYGAGMVYELIPNGDGKWKEKVLHDFRGGKFDGESPEGGVTFDAAGNLYGTTFFGGRRDCGTVFRLTPKTDGSWKFELLYSFRTGKDGRNPLSNLAVDSAGNIYGTTLYGGVDHVFCNSQGCGTVFELSPSGNGKWTETILHYFVHTRKDAKFPETGVILDAAGNLYGAVQLGGAHEGGIVYELAVGSWTESILYNFCSASNCADGSGPFSTLTFDSLGNLYGTTRHGGASNSGTAFELTPHSGTWSETVLYSFCSLTGCADGSFPNSGPLVFDSNGDLYGVTGSGGTSGKGCFGYGCGTVFELTPGNETWSESVLYNFPAGGKRGTTPTTGVILDSAGNLYGTTSWGGAYGGGTVFEITR